MKLLAKRLVRIRLRDERLLTDLLTFMRSADCIAHREGAGTLIIFPPKRGRPEKQVLTEWWLAQPEVELEIIED